MSYVEDDSVSHVGDASLSLTGEDDSFLAFQVVSSSREMFLREDVLGISFWLSVSENELNIDQLLIEVFGSDTFSYWVEDDISALVDIETFSGKRMYGLGLNRTLAPETWIHIEILLDNLVFDPNFDEESVEDFEYTYITGFAIHFTENFSGTIYLDEIQLLIWADE
jgi:hypothetical protein